MMPRTLATPHCYLPLLLYIFLSFNRAIASKAAKSIVRSHRGGESSASTTQSAIIATDDDDDLPTMETSSPSSVSVVFSDLDGTLIHYPARIDDLIKRDPSRSLVQLPPSSTGMVGVISAKTLQLCQQIRGNQVRLVLVSGMRTSTLVKRLPYLPKADAYCAEAGGRIFYASTNPTEASFRVDPRPYQGATQRDLEPFYLVEDLEWRRKMESIDAAGKDGFIGAELRTSSDSSETPVSVSKRTGALWAHARELENQGYVLDTKGYSTCFRVNQKQQTSSAADFDALLQGKIDCPTELATSTNLGCVDFYPASSGKRNW